MRRMFLRLLGLVAFFNLGAPPLAAENQSQPLFERVTEKARRLARETYAPADTSDLPEPLQQMSYDEYREIRFKKDRALWDGKSRFSVELFHRGFLYREPVTIHEIADGGVRQVPYDTKLFEYGDQQAVEGELGDSLGFAGFRIHYPINTADYNDEVVAFLGASYFRMVGRGQSYGLSARGLAVDTALPQGEEFPRFTEFWLVRPDAEATTVTFYALLDSESVTGAYRFRLEPGKRTALNVEARLFTREPVEKLGVAPLTSMFMWGENSERPPDDVRPEVHDSDGLLMHTGQDEWIWRPLTNPKRLQISSLMDDAPRGFGLAQRDRRFRSYHDLDSRYETRPGLWVSPLGGDWGKGVVQLVEIPSELESNDNIAAFWVPDTPIEAGERYTFRYRLETYGARRNASNVAAVQGTRIGRGGDPEAKKDKKTQHKTRRFLVRFSGGELEGLDPTQPVEARLSASTGEVTEIDTRALPRSDGWQVDFELSPHPDGRASDLRLHLTLHGRRVSETWNYVWDPERTG